MLHIYVNQVVESTGEQRPTLLLTISSSGELVSLFDRSAHNIPEAICAEIKRIAELVPQHGRDAFRYEGIVYELFTLTVHP